MQFPVDLAYTGSKECTTEFCEFVNDNFRGIHADPIYDEIHEYRVEVSSEVELSDPEMDRFWLKAILDGWGPSLLVLHLAIMDFKQNGKNKQRIDSILHRASIINSMPDPKD